MAGSVTASYFDRWIATDCASYGFGAVVILGPDVFGPENARRVLVAAPARVAAAEKALLALVETSAPEDSLAVWDSLHVAGEAEDELCWRHHWRQLGFRSFVRFVFPLVAGRSHEMLLFCHHEGSNEAALAPVAWMVMQKWPHLRRVVSGAACGLSPRERSCLALAFGGLTAKEIGVHLGCTERTVTYHLANAKAKLGTTTTIEAIRRGAWLGVL